MGECNATTPDQVSLRRSMSVLEPVHQQHPKASRRRPTADADIEMFLVSYRLALRSRPPSSSAHAWPAAF
jgi:hypothetical protein